MTRVGQYLRKARMERAMSLADVATATGISTGYLSRLERDRIDGRPSEVVLHNLADFLSLDFGTLAALCGVLPPEVRRSLVGWLDQGHSFDELRTFFRNG